MNLPSNPVTWLKLIGALSSGAGSLVLAWRVKELLKWVVYCLVAHEQSITQLRKIASNQPQTEPLVEGVPKHLLKIQDKLGLALLIVGFSLLGVGMLCNAATHLFGSP